MVSPGSGFAPGEQRRTRAYSTPACRAVEWHVIEPLAATRLPPASTQLDTRRALALFDTLAPVEVRFMFGTWYGRTVPTGHAFDGVLEACRWYGKAFHDAEHVDPLLFIAASGRATAVDPAYLRPALWIADATPLPKTAIAGWIFQHLVPAIAARGSCARLRMRHLRGAASATLVYDRLPVCDTFRAVDENTVLGLMHRAGSHRPFFFALRRAQTPPTAPTSSGRCGNTPARRR
jgi:hypothetical protein